MERKAVEMSENLHSEKEKKEARLKKKKKGKEEEAEEEIQQTAKNVFSC